MEWFYRVNSIDFFPRAHYRGVLKHRKRVALKRVIVKMSMVKRVLAFYVAGCRRCRLIFNVEARTNRSGLVWRFEYVPQHF